MAKKESVVIFEQGDHLFMHVDTRSVGNDKPKRAPKVKKEWNWYVLSVEWKREGTVRRALRRRVVAADLEGWFGRILNPKDKIEYVKETEKGTKRVVSSQNQLPGYILVQIASTTTTRKAPKARSIKGKFMKGGDRKIVTHHFNEDLMHLIKDTKHVIGLLPDHWNPVPEKREVIERFDRVHEPESFEGSTVKKVKLPYKVGDRVVLLRGSWKDAVGEISTIEGPDNAPKVTVTLTIWNRPVPLVVPYNEVKRI